MIFDLHKEQLPSETLKQLSDLADLAMVLGLDDTHLESFQAGLSQLHLDMTYHTRVQKAQEFRIRSIEKSHERAQKDLEDLRDLQRRWMEERESIGDMELRTRRRSTELSRIHTEEDEARLQELERRQREEGLDVDTRGLSIAQLEASDRSILELQEQLESQNKVLAAYQQLPPVSRFGKWCSCSDHCWQVGEFFDIYHSLVYFILSWTQRITRWRRSSCEKRRCNWRNCLQSTNPCLVEWQTVSD